MSKGEYSEPERSVFVGNLDKRVTEEIMWELFLQAGPLERVNIPKDKETGAQRSFGFVQFTSPVSVSYASQLMDGLCLYGQTIAVKPAGNKSPAPNQASSRSSPLTFNSDLSRNSPVPQFQMGNSQRHGQNSIGSNNSPRYQHGIPVLSPSLMQQQYHSRIHRERRY